MINNGETYRNQFEQDTQFERLVLDQLIPVIEGASSDVIDLRDAITGSGSVLVSAYSSCSLSDSAIASVTSSVMPLLYGAAWKTLDLLIEYLLKNEDQSSGKSKHWTIKDKASAASARVVPCPLDDMDQSVWNAICGAYSGTVEHRHCLVHRLANFSHSPLCLSGNDHKGQPLRPLVEHELFAFIRLAQLVSSAVLKGGVDSRVLSFMTYELNQLEKHIGDTGLNGKKACTPVMVKMILTKLNNRTFEADFAFAISKANRVMPDSIFDLWIEIPNEKSRHLFARLEDIPNEVATLNLEALPSYLSFR